MVDASLAYEILLYFNSFYFGLLVGCELITVVFKFTFKNEKLHLAAYKRDTSILMAFLLIEGIRVFFGGRGSLNDHGWRVITSVVLTIPCIFGSVFVSALQEFAIGVEIILGALLGILQSTELVYAIVFLINLCRRRNEYVP